MENRRISLRDLARMAKVSHATVSLALRNSPDVAAATRKRIEELARACGYQPDPMLRALAEYRRDKTAPPYQSTLAWINYYENPADADCVGDFRLHREGAEERARELGYKLELFAPCRDRLSSSQLGKILRTRGIQGLLIAPLPRHGKITDFDFSPFAAITFGYSLLAPQLHRVANDQFEAGSLALTRLREAGRRRIGFVTSRGLSERTNWNFIGGFLAAQAALPEKEKIPVFIHDETSLDQNGFRKMQPWFQAHRPDGMVTHFSEMREHLLKNGRAIPEKIAVALLSVTRETVCSGVNLNSKEVGRSAIDSLASMLYHNEKGIPELSKRILVQAVWQDGDTV